MAHTDDVVGNALVLSGGGFVGVAWELGVGVAFGRAASTHSGLI